MENSFKERIQTVCKDTVFDEPLSRHTSFRIGGPADVFATPETEKELADLIAFCDENHIKRTIIGNGSNILASDEGYRGVVIRIFRTFDDCAFEEDKVRAGAGILLSALASACTEHALTGLEFASGIPGALGGAVFMNAGAYGGEMKDVITSVRVYEPGSGIKEIAAKDMGFGYRTSVIKDSDRIVLGASLQLEKGDPDAIRARVNELKEMRTSKQPLEYPSAGSTFKRPKDHFAGKLIMDAGLRGYRIGGAQVSEKHCGFLINTGGATAKDVKELIDHVTKTVEDQFGITLEREVRYL